jgi:hypothetical protein
MFSIGTTAVATGADGGTGVAETAMIGETGVTILD